jgi:tripartite-type tricarboxylate transporter receptor subunit TctC
MIRTFHYAFLFTIYLTQIFLPSHASATDYPARAIKIVVPAGAGGITDILARILADRMGHDFGRSVIVENRPGAGGLIGTEAVVRSDPDGYTLLMAFPSLAANPSLYAKMPYNTEQDLAPVTMVANLNLIVTVPNSSPAHSIKELIAEAKTSRSTYASQGVGTLSHLANALFGVMAGIELTHITYRGLPQAEAAILSGEVSMFFDAAITALPQVKAGTVRALAVTSPKRLSAVPELPTVAEAGVPGYEVTGWNGILVPAATPRPIVDRLNAEIVHILQDEDVRKRLREVELEPIGNTPEEFAAILHSDIQKWRDVVRQAGIKAE